MRIAERNRTIKKVLTEAFKPHKVTVRGSRGTAHGWVSIKIDYRPRDAAERDELKKRVWLLFDAAKIEIGTYGYDDPGSDYGHGKKMHLDFGRCRDEFEAGERVTCDGKAGKVEPNWQARGWYFFQPDDDNQPTVEVYKSSLSAVGGAA